MTFNEGFFLQNETQDIQDIQVPHFENFYVFVGYSNILLHGTKIIPWLGLHLSLFYQKMFMGDFVSTSQYNLQIDENRALLNNFPIVPFNGIFNDSHLTGVVFYVNGQNFHLYQDLINFLNSVNIERPFVLNTETRNIVFNIDILFENKVYLEFEEDTREDAFEEFCNLNHSFENHIIENFFDQVGYEDMAVESIV